MSPAHAPPDGRPTTYRLNQTARLRQSVSVNLSAQRARRHIEDRMSELGIGSQGELAERAGVGVSTVQRLLNGTRVRPVKESAVLRALKWEPASLDEIRAGRSPIPLRGDAGAAEVQSPEPSETGNRSTSVTTVSFGVATEDDIRGYSDAQWAQIVSGAGDIIREMRRNPLISDEQTDETIRALVRAAELRNMDTDQLVRQILS